MTVDRASERVVQAIPIELGELGLDITVSRNPAQLEDSSAPDQIGTLNIVQREQIEAVLGIAYDLWKQGAKRPPSAPIPRP